MAITKTRSVQRVEVYPEAEGDERVMVVYKYVFDDADDDKLPVSHENIYSFRKTTTTVDSEGNETTSNTDISGEDALVQTVCNAVWS